MATTKNVASRGLDSMSNQQNPNTYALMCRCPLEDATAVKVLAAEKGVTMSAFVASLIHEVADGVNIPPNAQKWMRKRYASNKKIRAKADRDTAMGRYRARDL